MPGTRLRRPVERPERARRHATMIGFILYMLIIGLVAGALARLLVPGRDPMPLWQTWLLGAIGSFVGGFLGYALFKKDEEDSWFQASGIIGSVIGAIIVLLIWRAVQGRSGDRRIAR
jgi:uncharacterized membrane protein YeaQ/YmgE (transglycosylase-associated protein family)